MGSVGSVFRLPLGRFKKGDRDEGRNEGEGWEVGERERLILIEKQRETRTFSN